MQNTGTCYPGLGGFFRYTWASAYRPSSWQTSLGLGSMSRYSAHILICILRQYVLCDTEVVHRYFWIQTCYFSCFGIVVHACNIVLYQNLAAEWKHIDNFPFSNYSSIHLLLRISSETFNYSHWFSNKPYLSLHFMHYVIHFYHQLCPKNTIRAISVSCPDLQVYIQCRLLHN